jgi:hypothetical protein
MNVTFGILILTALLALCLLGLWHDKYNDNLLHCIGMSIVALWAVAAIARVVSIRYVAADDLFLWIGILCFGSGTAVRTWLYKRKRNRG